jgi:hypothetical protein
MKPSKFKMPSLADKYNTPFMSEPEPEVKVPMSDQEREKRGLKPKSKNAVAYALNKHTGLPAEEEATNPRIIDDKLQPLAGQRHPHESNKQVRACNDYLEMGIGRSLMGLIRWYKKLTDKTGDVHSVPTLSYNTLYAWSMDYVWFRRADLYDVRTDALREQHQREALTTGAALPFNRIHDLMKLKKILEGELDRKLWLPDVKIVGFGKYSERIDIIRFNAGLVEQYRKVVEDIAAETGGRVKQSAVRLGEEGDVIEVSITKADKRAGS